jgi:hypothetical protein
LRSHQPRKVPAAIPVMFSVVGDVYLGAGAEDLVQELHLVRLLGRSSARDGQLSEFVRGDVPRSPELFG